MFAVIKTGGKQYLVEPGKKIKIEKLEDEEGKEVIFDQVLLLYKGNKLEIGEPLVEGAKVTAKVLTQGKAKKVIALRYKAKKRVHVKTGHRQRFTEVEIIKI
ncbi:MAG: 50S ribosomal protein L21 [Candidatus Pacebacteria bacterium]|nr:50S ribosomal protein L21 [Candidatus Paceibacterota bacterium]